MSPPSPLSSFASPRHVAAWNRLLAEMEAGRLDSPTARDSVRQLGALGLLVRAWAHTQRRELTAARRCVDAALTIGGDSATTLLIAAILAVLLREPRTALARLRAASRANPAATHKAVELELHITRRITWMREMHAVARRALTEAPLLTCEAHAALAQVFAEADLFDTALEHATRALPAVPSIHQALEHAGLAARAWRSDVAMAMVEVALRDSAGDPGVLLAACDILVAIGAFERAKALLHGIIARFPTHSEAMSRLAELHLWEGEDEVASDWAARALAIDPACPRALRSRGIAELHRQHIQAALKCFETATAVSPRDAQSFVWQARARFALDDPEGGLRALDDAAKIGGNLAAAELLRFQHEVVRTLRLGLPSADGRAGLSRQLVEPCLAFLRLIHPDAGTILMSEDGHAQLDLFQQGLDALGANYSSLTTLRRDGHLRRAHVTFIRQEAVNALQTIRVLPVPEVREHLQEVIARYPESALPICYRGELEVWLGNTAAARHWLERAIEHTRTTRWAYIGMAACEILERRYDKALEVLALGIERMAGTVGPAVYPHRGEALRHLRRYEEARADLDLALATSPRRLSTWINLALLEAAVGDEAALTRAFEHVRRHASGLIVDAAEEIGETAWHDGDRLPSFVAQRRLLEHALVMLRGNRATGLVTYFRADGALQVCSPIDTDLARYDRWDLETSWSLIEMLSPARRTAT